MTTTPKMPAHTPTPLPWGTLEGPRSNLLHIEGPNGAAVCSVPKSHKANAALIVERVNGWEALQAQRDEMQGEIVHLTAERDQLKAALQQVEWEGGSFINCGACPSCGNESKEGHESDCIVGRALGGGR